MNFALRPMSTAEILDRTFNLYRNNFFLFAGIAVLPSMLGLILEIIGITANLTVRTPGRSFAETRMMSYTYDLLVLFIASVIGGAIATGATVYAVYCLNLGKTATIRESYKSILDSWVRVIVASVLAFLVIVVICGLIAFGLGSALFWSTASRNDVAPWVAGVIVLGMIAVVFLCWVYLSSWLSFVIPGVVLGQNTILRSFRRSHQLSKGSRGRIFFVLLLTLILTLVFTWTLRIPGYMIFNQFRQEVSFDLWAYGARFLSTILAGPIATIAIALFYIDQRIRKEAFDLHVMMQFIQERDQMASAATAATIT